MMPGVGAVEQECIRQATPQDIEALVDIYIECFPDRVKEIFGTPPRRTFIRDYLLFYLSWDPLGNWVYVRDDTVMGFVMIPGRYAPWRAMLAHGQLFRWMWHFLTGAYGLPLHLVKQFVRGGFRFSSDPAIKRLWGRPYIHLIAVRGADQARPSRGLLGSGRRLLQWALAEQCKRGANCCWAVVQPTGARFIPIWKRTGFKIVPLSNGESLALWGNVDDHMGHPEWR
ncbi:MAG TPA: hypothetical protein VNP04_17605 [Alphaproteobacteria bacterium]|nr:hypothetical protein [Alphaproteobacteria bacterium]